MYNSSYHHKYYLKNWPKILLSFMSITVAYHLNLICVRFCFIPRTVEAVDMETACGPPHRTRQAGRVHLHVPQVIS